MKKAVLTLKNGISFWGKGHGQCGVYPGELVFTTSMTGYVEAMTDPSFKDQILTFSYPLIGNYGVNKKWQESNKIKVSAVITSEICNNPIHRNSEISFEQYLYNQKIGAISGVDTRQIVKQIKNEGCIHSILSVYKTKDFAPNNLMKSVTTKFLKEYNPKGRKIIALIDYGVKNSIVKELIKRGFKVICFPATAKKDQILSIKPDGILLSNGPGDPSDYIDQYNTIKVLLKNKLPILGICLGHQLLGLAIGVKTFKLKFGHRGSNQPVINQLTKNAYIISQNHGFCIDQKSLPKNWNVWFKNLNDDTLEGMKHKSLPFMSIQFHPEAKPGPLDTNFIYDEFSKLIYK